MLFLEWNDTIIVLVVEEILKSSISLLSSFFCFSDREKLEAHAKEVLRHTMNSNTTGLMSIITSDTSFGIFLSAATN